MISVDLLQGIKELGSLVEKIKSKETMDQFMKMQVMVSQLITRNTELEQEVSNLKRRLDLREDLKFVEDKGWYRKQGDRIPFCPICQEKYEKAIHLQRLGPGSEDFECVSCGWPNADRHPVAAVF
jgi:hypothetical protein